MKFQELSPSPYYIAISVPSTKNTSEAVSTSVQLARTEEISRALSSMFGGASVSDVSGEWVSTEDGRYIQEPIKRVLSYASEVTPDTQDKIISLARAKCKEWEQEAIMLEYKTIDGTGAVFITQ